MRYKLQVLNQASGSVDREWILHLPAIVGRSPDVDVPIGDASISRRHCQFFLNANDALSVRDFDSLNGTYIDDQRIKNRATLKPGDVVRVGSVCLKLEWTDEDVTEEKMTHGKLSADSTQPMRTISKNDLR